MKGYFNSVGFERWNKIYGTTDEISSVSPVKPHVEPAHKRSRLHAIVNVQASFLGRHSSPAPLSAWLRDATSLCLPTCKR